MKNSLSFLALTAGLAATGCAAFERPSMDFRPDLPDVPDSYQALAVQAASPMDGWLNQFGDQRLEALVNEALQRNPSLAARKAFVDAARASARSTRGRVGPSVDADVSFGVTAFGTDDTSTSLGAGVSAVWEADLWGRLDRTVNAAEADLTASEADLASAALSVAAQTALAWYDVKEAAAQLDLARLTLEIRQRTLDTTLRRVAQGSVTALDVRTARSALAQAEASIAARELALGNAARRLETLLGRYPAGQLLTDPSLPDLAALPMGGDPVMLLSRRPDLAAAEARLKASGFRAEAARLALRPSLRLTGGVDLSGEDFDELFDVDRMVSRVVAGLAQPIFNGGSLEADADAAYARAQADMADYVFSVISAWREVEDAIQADISLGIQEEAQLRALEEARFAEGIAERQYLNGVTTIFNLIDAQNRRLSAESAVISARAARIANRIQYHLALGGGVPFSSAGSAALGGGSVTP